MKAYTLGRGLLMLDSGNGFEEFGNVTDFTVSVETEKLEHYSTASGIKVKDAEIVKSLNYNVKFEIDELKKSTLEKFILGTGTVKTQTAGTVTDENISGVKQGLWYRLANWKVSNVVVTDSGGTTTYQEDIDYKVDYEVGAIYILEGGNIADGSTILVDYTIPTLMQTAMRLLGEQDFLYKGTYGLKEIHLLEL